MPRATDTYLRGNYGYSGRMAGERPLPYENPVLRAFDEFQAAKTKRRAEEREDAQYAVQVAEMAGEVTPELEQQILAPLGQDPSAMDRLIGDTGRMFGSDTERGMAQPFTVPGGLKTQYERGLAEEGRKYSQKQKDELTKHLQQIERASLSKQEELGIKRTEKEEGLVDEPLTIKDRENLKKIGRGEKSLLNKIGGVKEKIKQALFNGTLTVDNMTQEHWIALGLWDADDRALAIFKLAQGQTKTALEVGDINKDGVAAYQAELAVKMEEQVSALAKKIGGGNGKDKEWNKLWNIK